MSTFKLTNYDEAWLASLSGPGSIIGGTQGSGGSNSLLTAYELRNEGGDPLQHDHGAFGATETIDPTLGNVHTGTLDDDVTVTLSPPAGDAATLLLWLTQDGTGGWSITWAGSVTEMGAPDTSADTTNLAVATTVDSGTTWVVAWVGGSGGAASSMWVPVTTYDGTNWMLAVDGSGNAIMTEVPL